MKEMVKLANDLQVSIQKLRLNNELNYYILEYNKTIKKNITSNDTIWNGLKKNVSNALNSSTNEKYFHKIHQVEELIYRIDSNKHTIYSENELYEKFNTLFVQDKYGLGKLEFAMNVLLDNIYEFETNPSSYDKISTMLGYNNSYLINLEKNMKLAYCSITNNKNNNLKTAAIVSGIIAIPLLISGVGAAIGGFAASASITTSGLASLFGGIGMAKAVAGLCLSSVAITGGVLGSAYFTLDASQKYKLKRDFARLSVDETTVSLVKTIMSILQIKNYKDDADAQKIYESYVEEYIDLKSDVDLRLFINNEEIEENKKKNTIFNNADNYLITCLF